MTTAEPIHSTVVPFPTKRKHAVQCGHLDPAKMPLNVRPLHAQPPRPAGHGLRPEDDPMRVLVMSMLMLMPARARQDILQMTMQRPWERPSERTAAPSRSYDILNQIQLANWDGVHRED